MCIDKSIAFEQPLFFTAAESITPGRNTEARCCRLSLSPHFCYWIKELNLKELDRKNLLKGAPLTDSHMNGCGLLISKQFPELQMPQNTLCPKA